LPWCVRVRFRTAPCHPCRFLQRISRSAPTSPLLASGRSAMDLHQGNRQSN
jgi:hypothetical protein